MPSAEPLSRPPARRRGALVALALAGAAAGAHADPDALWRLIDQRCVPHALAGEAPAPCAEAHLAPDRDHGWVVLKDQHGRLQFLTMPSAKITGIEAPALEAPGATDYFADAWSARGLLDKLNGAPLPRDTVSLSVNSQPRRSQNQLHVHISCVRPELRARLLAAQAEIGRDWTPLPGGWLRHEWYVRRVDAGPRDTLASGNPFEDVAAHVPGAGADMARATIGVVALRFADGRDGFVLMASRAAPDDPSSGSAEDDLQDHDCAILGAPPAS